MIGSLVIFLGAVVSAISCIEYALEDQEEVDNDPILIFVRAGLIPAQNCIKIQIQLSIFNGILDENFITVTAGFG